MSYYFKEALTTERRPAIIERTLRCLAASESFDTIVTRGVSGLAVAPIVAHVLKVNLAIIRKPSDSAHSYAPISGDMGARYAIVDDFIDTGATVKIILAAIEKDFPAATCVGFAGYGDWWWDQETHGSRQRTCDRLGVRLLFPKNALSSQASTLCP